jgi:hypothetical protein
MEKVECLVVGAGAIGLALRWRSREPGGRGRVANVRRRFAARESVEEPPVEMRALKEHRKLGSRDRDDARQARIVAGGTC